MKKHEIAFLLVLSSSIFTKDLILIFIKGIIYMIFFPPFSEKNEKFMNDMLFRFMEVNGFGAF